MKNSKNKKASKLAGYYRGIVADFDINSISGIAKSSKKMNLRLQWDEISDGIEIASISIPVKISEQGFFFPEVTEYANAGFEKLLARGFKPPQGMELKDQIVDAFLIRNRTSLDGRAYMISLGPPVVVAALNQLIVKKVEISYKKFNLRSFCDYLFKNPNFTDLIVKRLNCALSGRENPADVTRCSLGGRDVFKSKFFSDLIGITDKDRREDYNPFLGDPGPKRSRWSIEPNSCRITNGSFWMNLDTYGNFLFHYKSEKDMISLVESLQVMNQISRFLDCAIPLKREDQKLAETPAND